MQLILLSFIFDFAWQLFKMIEATPAISSCFIATFVNFMKLVMKEAYLRIQEVKYLQD